MKTGWWKFFVLLGVLLILGTQFTNQVSAQCWKEPRKCVDGAVDKVVDVTEDVVDAVVDVTENTLEFLLPDQLLETITSITADSPLIPIFSQSCGSGLIAYIVPDRFGVPVTGPQANFKPACDTHDACYDAQSGREFCDNQFEENLKEACAQSFNDLYIAFRPICDAVAVVYADAVRKAGGDAYADALSFDTIYLRNDCGRRIQGGIHYKNLDDNWVTMGWWILDPGESEWFAKTRNRFFYVYAESIDPVENRLYWSGDAYYYSIHGSSELYGFFENQITTDDWGTWTQGFTCN